MPGDWLARLIEDWRAFDPLSLQARLDRLTHLRAEVDGVSVHLVHAPGTGPDPLPLVLTHGWPSSFLEYLALLPLLTDPAAHGGDAADAFTVVLPSLPGFGFSGPPPPGGLTYPQVAELWHTIMTGVLGYRRYAAHGSDLGAGVTAWLARAHPAEVAAIHLATPGLAAPPKPWTDPVSEHFAEVKAWFAEEGGYSHMHATKPATIGAAPRRLTGRAGRVARREAHPVEQHHGRRAASLRPGPAAVHAHPVLDDQDGGLVAAPVLGLPACAGQRAARRRPGARPGRDRHLRW